jgi:hypothetical protein
VSTNDVYVRSLSHNNTPSTGKPRWDTWEKILDPLFENREADLMDLLTALCNDIEPGILGAWPPRRCSKQALMYRRCDASQCRCKLL